MSISSLELKILENEDDLNLFLEQERICLFFVGYNNISCYIMANILKSVCKNKGYNIACVQINNKHTKNIFGRFKKTALPKYVFIYKYNIVYDDGGMHTKAYIVSRLQEY